MERPNLVIRIFPMVVFLSIVVSVLAAIHYYFWLRLVSQAALPAPWRQLATAVIVLLGLSLPTVMVVGRLFAPEQVRWFAVVAYLWMGLLLFVLLTLGVGDIVRWLLLRLGPAELQLHDPARRMALSRLVGGGAVVISLGLGALAWQRATRPLTVKRVEIPMQGLPPALDGFSIVQLTDIHIGPTLGREFIEEIVEKTNALKPDFVAITGDLVDGSVANLQDKIAPLADLHSRFGTFFVTGNHEYYSGVNDWIEFLSHHRVRTLHNERVVLERDGGQICVAGIDDPTGRGVPGHGPNLKKTLATHPDYIPVVLLAHQPKAVMEAANFNVKLQLSGHTHGGQIWPWRYLVYLQQPYLEGLHNHEGTQLYVSTGTGYWGPPMRLGTSAEITQIILRAPKAAPLTKK